MIDRQKFNDTFQYFDKEIIVEIIDLFISEYPERFDRLHKNIADKDFVALKFNAHSLKGVIANFRDPETTRLSILLDEMAKNRTENGVEQVFNDLQQGTLSLIEELKKMKKEFTS